ncbi:MAG: glycosyltransferase [Thermodesulfobacteriota bacterium]|nr:glycosyltransferase [Thermodesulfobacteriota bacterium]
MSLKLSVVVPAYNAEKTLPALLDSLLNQNCSDFEVIVVDDCSRDNTVSIIEKYSCRLIALKENHGPAYCRNLGAQKAQGEILVFTDSDCRATPGWLETIEKHFHHEETEAIMGRVVLLPSTCMGNSISALGFPAGGAIGFDKIWKVDREGFTDSLSSCNCAVRRDIFWRVGGFDETFPFPGGEDSLLAYGMRRLGYRIKYCPDVVAYHEARDSLRDFLTWQFHRGISSFIFSTKISDKKGFLSLRIWSTVNIIKHYFSDKRFPLIFLLLGTSFVTQLVGFIVAKSNRSAYACVDD